MPRNLLLALFCSLAVAVAAQPTWRFHLAFEDGTGARDTLWLIYDTAVVQTQSHWPVDIGEYQQSRINLDYSDGAFHVFTINDLIDSTNSMAFPYSWFPIFETGNSVDAINWTPPMTITWDTSLFHAPYLPYSQGHFGIAIMDGLAFSAYMNHPDLGFGVHDMLINDSLTVSELTDYLFTFGVYFGPDDHVGIRQEHADNAFLSISPNPARSTIQLRAHSALEHIRILDLLGRSVEEIHEPYHTGTVDIASLSPGVYIVLARSTSNQLYHGKFQKVD